MIELIKEASALRNKIAAAMESNNCPHLRDAGTKIMLTIRCLTQSHHAQKPAAIEAKVEEMPGQPGAGVQLPGNTDPTLPPVRREVTEAAIEAAKS